MGDTLASLSEEPSARILVAGTERGLLKAQPLLRTDPVAAVTVMFSQSENQGKVSLSRKSISAHGQSIVETALHLEGIASAPLDFPTSVQT